MTLERVSHLVKTRGNGAAAMESLSPLVALYIVLELFQDLSAGAGDLAAHGDHVDLGVVLVLPVKRINDLLVSPGRRQETPFSSGKYPTPAEYVPSHRLFKMRKVVFEPTCVRSKRRSQRERRGERERERDEETRQHANDFASARQPFPWGILERLTMFS